MKLDLRDILIGGLLLPLRLYFRPLSFADEVEGSTPDLLLLSRPQKVL